MSLLPINENEAILEAFWNGDKNGDDSRLDVLAPYRVTWSKGASGSVRPPAYFTLLAPPASGPALILERDCDVDLGGYDRFVLGGSLPKSVRVRLLARLDGRWQTVIADAVGSDACDEFEGAFRGSRLTGLRFEFTLSGPAPAAVSLTWLMVADSAGLARMLTRKTAFDPSWPGLLESSDATARPQLGLFFDAADLKSLRAKVRLRHLKPHYEALLAQADKFLAIQPEELVGSYAPGGDITRSGRKVTTPWIAHGVADLLAFAGIVEENPAFSRQAARMALALAHCGHWTHSFLGVLPGTIGHPRCFSESYILLPLPMVLDWAGHCLTPVGRELIRDAMILKGLARVESDFRRWEYIRHMNQGLLFTPGRIHAYLALEKTYPRYRANLAEAERDMNAMLDHYLQPDGGTLEGMGYWHSVGEVFPTLYAMARRHGKPFLVGRGERVRRTSDFALAMLSTADHGDEFLRINQIGSHHARPSLMMAAVFATAMKGSSWGHRYARIAAEADPEADWFHLLVAPETLPGRAAKSEESPFYHFPATGHAGVRREAGGIGAVRFHLFSGPSRGGHSHQDKGSFLVEAAGETLVMDRGTTGYGDPVHLLMGKAAWHNLVVPETADGTPMEQHPLTTPGGKLTLAKFSNGVFDIKCDNRRAWEPGLFRRNLRRVHSSAAGVFEIEDDLSLRTSHAVAFRLNCPHTLTQDDTGAWTMVGKRARLRITPVNWKPVAATATVAGVDWLGHPVWLLRMATAVATSHRLLTLLEVLPK
jgi:hypothetical protein